MQHDTKPLVSVIIPTHNRAAIVPQAINSVLQQSFTDYELIVVDDASTDDTAERLQGSYGEKIRYIRKSSNAGPSAARNIGMQVARGVYIAFLDDDDEWLPEKLHLQVQLMEQNQDIGLVYCGCVQVDETGDLIGQVMPEKRGMIFKELLFKNYILTSATVIRKALVRKSGGFDKSMPPCEDWDLWIRISRHCLVDYINQPLVRYKIHKQGIHTDMQKMEKNTFLLLKKYQAGMSDSDRNRLLSEKSIYWAWQYYDVGNKNDFSRLLLQAMQAAPGCNNIFNYEGDIAAKERDFFAVLDSFWNSRGSTDRGPLENQAYACQFRQLAWEYYHRGDLLNFRRCARKVFYYLRPRIPLRLLGAYVKSLLGKAAAEKIHYLRKRIYRG